MTVFRAATLRTFFFAFHAGAKELSRARLNLSERDLTCHLDACINITEESFA